MSVTVTKIQNDTRRSVADGGTMLPLFSGMLRGDIVNYNYTERLAFRSDQRTLWLATGLPPDSTLLKKAQERRIMILAFANNHYAGHGASTVELFRRLGGIETLRVVHPQRGTGQQSSLFD
jgi:hypothetical protein